MFFKEQLGWFVGLEGDFVANFKGGKKQKREALRSSISALVFLLFYVYIACWSGEGY